MTIINSEITINYPLFGLIISLILFAGLHRLGDILLRVSSINNIFSKISDTKYQKILLASNFLAAGLMPIVLFTTYSKYLIILTSFILLILGFIQFTANFNLYVKFKNIYLKNFSFDQILFLLLIFGFFLVTLAPINHADSLDYHVSVAKHILNEGEFPSTIFNPHHLLAGAGEILISLGYVFGAEQFGTLIQLSGIISLIGIIKKISKNKYLYILLAIGVPSIIFLVSSPKPQLFPLCSNIVIFVLLFFNPEKFFKNKKEIYIVILISLIFLINSINTKFSFILSSSILLIYLIKFSYKSKVLREALLISFFCGIVFYFPLILWKYVNFGGNFFSYIFNPLPTHIPGIDLFKGYLMNFSRQSSLIFAIIPRNLKQITDPIGLGVIIIIFLYYFNNYRSQIIFVVLSFIVIVFLFGQPSGRFFLEPYLWILIVVSKYDKNFINFPLKLLFRAQFIFVIAAVYFAVLTLSIGSLNSSLRDKVMTKTANGYSLYKWSNSLIRDDGTVLSMHRSVSLGKTKTVSTTFLFYMYNIENSKIYIEQIEETKPKYFLTYHNQSIGVKENKFFFKNCLGPLIAKKENVGMHAARNPFNRGSPYTGYLYELKKMKLSECIEMNDE